MTAIGKMTPDFEGQPRASARGWWTDVIKVSHAAGLGRPKTETMVNKFSSKHFCALGWRCGETRGAWDLQTQYPTVASLTSGRGVAAYRPWASCSHLCLWH